MSGTPTIDAGVELYLRLFYPQYFDPDSDQFVDPTILYALSTVAYSSRPKCLSSAEQDMAQAWFTAYLVGVRQETSSGNITSNVSGPITSEKEGDIAVTYADLSASGGNSDRPSNDPWEAWNKMWQRCARGAILTRFGDVSCGFPPLQPTQTMDSNALTRTLRSYANAV